MTIDIRAEAAHFYDLSPDVPQDVDFYLEQVRSPEWEVLELGCGTGRVLLPMAGVCSYIHGVDISEAMVEICKGKLSAAGFPPTKAQAEVGDLAHLRLGKRFDLITAPYRVFQNLATDAEVDAFFETVRTHLAPGGSCILNVFHPNHDEKTLRRVWAKETEDSCWEVPLGDQRVTCHARNVSIDEDRLVLHPELIYRSYRGNVLEAEAVLKIQMRCYYPEELEELVAGHGFRVLERWGGYSGEEYGQGPELVLRFSARG